MKVIKKFELVDGKEFLLSLARIFEVDFQLDYKNEIIGKKKYYKFSKDNLKEVGIKNILLIRRHREN